MSDYDTIKEQANELDRLRGLLRAAAMNAGGPDAELEDVPGLVLALRYHLGDTAPADSCSPTISEIVDACQEREPVGGHDLRLCVLSLYYRLHLHEQRGYDQGKPQEERIRSMDTWRKFMNATPGKWLGDGWTPGTEENITRRRVAKAIFEKAAGEKL